MSTFAERVHDNLGPALHAAAGGDGPQLLIDLVDALTAGVERSDQLTTETPGGWLAAFDLATTPEPAWLGNLTGTQVPGGLTLEQQRAYVLQRPSWRRGTLRALRQAALAYLTGAQHLEVVERDGSPWRLTVRVFAAEISDQAALRAALLEQKPVGIVLNLDIRLGASFEHMRTQHGPTFTSARAQFPTFSDAKTHLPEGAS